MAKYAINEEGAFQLKSLSNDILQCSNCVIENGQRLKVVISSIGNNLGIYEEEIITLIDKQNQILNANRDDIISLATSIALKSDEVMELSSFVTINAGVGQKNGSSASGIIKNFVDKLKSGASDDKDEEWNVKYMPLVQANIRQSVNRLFSKYVTKEKVEESLKELSFMSQKDLKNRYGRGFKKGTLGFNDGKASSIAYDISGLTRKGSVGEHMVYGSGNANINYAFVTAVHENLHMMSANDTPYEQKRGIMVGNNENARAMNEAFTEYFTYLSCGGDEPLGGLYPGEYSGYHVLMREMPKVENIVGRECMMEAYFNNRPERMEEAIDKILGDGAWNDMCNAAYDLLYCDSNDAASRLKHYFDRMT